MTSDTQPSAAALYDIIRFVRPLYRHLAKAVEDRLEGTAITVPMRAVLERLCDEGAQTVPQLGRGLMLPRQFTQRIVNDLLALGHVERMPNAAHKRSWLISASPSGEEAFRAIKAREAAVLDDVAKGMTAAEVAACHRVMAHLTASFAAIAEVSEDRERGD